MPRKRGILDRQVLPGAINRVVHTTLRGQFIAKKWPKPAGKATAPALIASQQRFADCQKLIKFVSGDAMDDAIKIAKGTGLYPRDVLMSAMTVGLYDIATTDGYVITNAQYYLRPAMFQGAIVQRSTNQAIPAGIETALSWDNPIVQTVPILNAAQPTRLTVPANTTIIELVGKIHTVAATNGGHILIIRNQANELIAVQQETSNASVGLTINSGPISVSPGDWFRLLVFFAAAGTVRGAKQTGFAMNLLQVTV